MTIEELIEEQIAAQTILAEMLQKAHKTRGTDAAIDIGIKLNAISQAIMNSSYFLQKTRMLEKENEVIIKQVLALKEIIKKKDQELKDYKKFLT